jgi:putative flippase GtrA
MIMQLGVGHKTAMTLSFVCGVVQGFFLNKNWTFKHPGNSRETLLKYLGVYAAAYAVNFFALFIFVDRLGYAHQLVQGVAILAIAAMLFITLRLWVFADSYDFGAFSRDLPQPPGTTERLKRSQDIARS